MYLPPNALLVMGRLAGRNCSSLASRSADLRNIACLRSCFNNTVAIKLLVLILQLPVHYSGCFKILSKKTNAKSASPVHYNHNAVVLLLQLLSVVVKQATLSIIRLITHNCNRFKCQPTASNCF